MDARAAHPWFTVHRRASPRARLLCFPFAGGNAGSFAHWASHLPADVELWAMQPPGRATRIAEPPLTTMGLLLDQVEPFVTRALDCPTVFFGHSMGAIVGFELCRRLRRRGAALPAALVLSGREPPQHRSAGRLLHQLSNAQLRDELRRLGGTPEELLRLPDLLDLVLPALRADLACIEMWEHAAEPPLPIPLIVLGGADDREADPEQLPGWRPHSAIGCSVHIFSGDHFFINEHSAAIMQLVSRVFATAFS